MQKTLRKPVLAVAALAAGAAIALTGCSSDSTDNATSSAVSAATSATDQVKAAVDGLDNAQAQDILRTAVDPATPAADLDSVVDAADPATTAALMGFAKGATAAGYTPDAFTVTSVSAAEKVDGKDAATVTVSVKSPHVPQPIDMPLVFVEVDGTWKLSSDAVTQLAAMGR